MVGIFLTHMKRKVANKNPEGNEDMYRLQRVNVDFPIWMIEKLDREATKLGLARQALIKFFVAEKLGYNAAAD